MPILKSEDYKGLQISVFDETVLRPDGEGDSPSMRYSVYIDGQDVSKEVVRAGFTPEQLVERARQVVDCELAEVEEGDDVEDLEGGCERHHQ